MTIDRLRVALTRTDVLYKRVRTQFSKKEVSDLSFVVTLNNGWTRWG